MKLRSVFALSLVMLLTAAIPALGAAREPTGNRIFMFQGDQEYPAGTAFHMLAGWLNERGTQAIGRYSVSIEVDGASVPATYRMNVTNADAIGTAWVWNFPAGMTGTHIFVQRYLAPCGDVLLPCGGNPPNTIIEAASFTATITFVP